MELSKKNEVHLKDLVFLSEFQKGLQRTLENQKEKKRNEKNSNPAEVFWVTFRIPKENSNLAQTEKEEKRKKEIEGNWFQQLKPKRREKKETEKSRFLLHEFIF